MIVVGNHVFSFHCEVVSWKSLQKTDASKTREAPLMTAKTDAPEFGVTIEYVS